MANVKTYHLFIKLYDSNTAADYSILYHNISRTAVKYYLDWYKEDPEFHSYILESNSQFT